MDFGFLLLNSIQLHATRHAVEYNKPDRFYLLLSIYIQIVLQFDAKLCPGKGKQFIDCITAREQKECKCQIYDM